MNRSTALTFIVLLTMTAPLSSQEHSVSSSGPLYQEADAGGARAFKGCRDPRQRVGLVSGGGEISFQLKDNGEPDTASIAVLSASRISPAGLRSALVRLMERCRFEPGKIGGKRVTVQLYRRITLDSARLAFDPVPAGTSLESLPDQPARLVASEYDINDPAIEERPRSCKFNETQLAVPDFRPVDASNEQEVRENAARVMAENSGIVRMFYVIGNDGRVNPATYDVVSSTNSRLLPRAKQIVLGCRYDPARVAGVPVRVRVIWTITFGNPNPTSTLH